MRVFPTLLRCPYFAHDNIHNIAGARILLRKRDQRKVGTKRQVNHGPTFDEAAGHLSRKTLLQVVAHPRENQSTLKAAGT